MALSTAPVGLGAAARTRVLRSGPGELPWEMWQRTPPAPLAGLVLELWAGVSPRPLTRHRTMPNGELMLMLHLGSGQRLVEREGAVCDEVLSGSFVAGLRERPATFESLEAFARVAAVRLRPLGGWVLLGRLPQAELAGGVIDGEAVLGSSAGLRALRERMAEAQDLGAALDLLEAWLLDRFDGAACPHPATRAAAALLERSAGALRVEEVAREVGVSRRRLRELFLREVGVPAKRLARILRFRRALEQLATAPALDLARLALECGYADQSHLYRDFRDLATMTPLAYRAALGEGLDGPDVLSG